MQESPQSEARTVLQPITVDVDIVLQEYRRSELEREAQALGQRLNPRLEIYARLSDVELALTHAQYVYMLHVLDERLAWSADVVSAEQRAERIMEEARQDPQQHAPQRLVPQVPPTPARVAPGRTVICS